MLNCPHLVSLPCEDGFIISMRRSGAPSSKRGPPLHKPVQVSKEVPFTNAVRSTDSILSLLTENDKVESDVTPNSKSGYGVLKEQDNNAEQALKEGMLVPSVIPMTEGKKLFNVVWGKQSTKKHKTWEGDGTLEVSGKSAILKDTEGKVMGETKGSKVLTLQEGSRLLIGGKEVEVIDLVKSDEAMVKTKTTVERIPPRQNDCKRLKKSSSNMFTVPFLKPVAQSTLLDHSPLILPQPSHEHQWEYNTSRLPVTEVDVHPHLSRVLRPHQREGVVFLYECVMAFRKTNCHGAILADEMGLGKTLQCIVLIWTLLKQGPYGGQPVLKKVLIVTPSSLVNNWQKEFSCWLGMERIRIFVVDQKNKPKDFKKTQGMPVLLMSYEMFSRSFKDIQDIQFDLLICDEGHRLKNSSIKISTLLTRLDCKRKVLLSGTPIQNDLQEFYALATFVNPGVLGTNSEFRKYYEEPIVASHQAGSSNEVRKFGEKRAAELNKCTSWFILRRTQEIIDKYLPTKQEVVVFCCISQLQKEMYAAAVSYWKNREELTGSDSVPHLSVMTALKKICNHPALVLNAVVDGSENVSQNLAKTFSSEQTFQVSLDHSSKLCVVLNLLQELRSSQEKIVLVSNFTQTLDMLAHVCETYGYTFCRLDGSTPTSHRQSIVDSFNRPHSSSSVFLLSARAGGVGLNLTGASRLLLYDLDWNPATDLQAMSRIWRDGQKRNVYIYRLLTTGTIEEKMFQRQVCKTGLSGAVVDLQENSAVRLSEEELKDLFTLHTDQESLTHSLLDCSCSGSGNVSAELHSGKQSDLRDCQLETAQPSTARSIICMNQLMQWEHHSQPIKTSVLEEVGLQGAAHLITFMFRNYKQFQGMHKKPPENTDKCN